MVSSLSLKKQTGQMLFAGFEGVTVNSRLEKLIRDRGVGGLVLFERNFENPDQLLQLIRDAQKLACSVPPQVPLFISVDQEGGRVSRLKSPFTQFPPPCCLGEARSESLAQRFGAALAAELKAVGINMVFAPVLDVHSNPDNPIIGQRALSDQPEWAARLGVSVIRGIRETGLVPVGKHFPGHGHTSLDSHLDLPFVRRESASLEEVELVPFVEAIRDGLEAIMTAHVIYPAWDAEYPATFSKPILREILRDRLGFEGLIISDDLEMKAVEDHFSLEEFPSLGVEAGVDLFLVCHGQDKIGQLQEHMIHDLESKRIPASCIEQSVRRILHLKNRLALPAADPPDLYSLSDAHRKLVEEMKTHQR